MMINMKNINKTIIKNAQKKIDFTKVRIEKFIEWEPQKEFKPLKTSCIAALKEQVLFLEAGGHSDNS